jgi:hypothetical protein
MECHYAKCRGTTVPASVQVGNANLSTIFYLKNLRIGRKK